MPFNNERLSITQWLLGSTREGWFSVPLGSRCNRLITALSSPASYSLRQGLSADVAARPSAHPLVPISINLTQNAITVQSAPVAASWCRAVCAVMSLHSLCLALYLSFSLSSSLADKFFDIPYLSSLFCRLLSLISATSCTIGADDGSCKRAYGKSHVRSNIALVHPCTK